MRNKWNAVDMLKRLSAVTFPFHESFFNIVYLCCLDPFQSFNSIQQGTTSTLSSGWDLNDTPLSFVRKVIVLALGISPVSLIFHRLDTQGLSTF